MACHFRIVVNAKRPEYVMVLTLKVYMAIINAKGHITMEVKGSDFGNILRSQKCRILSKTSLKMLKGYSCD